jgi:hypothetical protein
MSPTSLSAHEPTQNPRLFKASQAQEQWLSVSDEKGINIAVAVQVDIYGGGEGQYEQIAAGLFPDGNLPEGWLLHFAGPTEDGWRAINVVQSRDRFEAFARDQLVPAVQQAGDLRPQVTYFPINTMINARR